MTWPEPSAVRWWLWPNVLALDAPAVAVVWQRFLGDSFGVAVPDIASVVLALVVWAIYLIDRLMDGRRGDVQPRHRFAATHTVLVTALAAVALLAAAPLVHCLPAPFIAAGAVVALLVTAYLALVHAVAPTLGGPKELLVGILFAAGVAIPLIASETGPHLWFTSVGAFGLLCWLNCRLIDRWEAASQPPSVEESLLGGATLAMSATCPRSLGVALAAAVGFLLLLHLRHRRLGSDVSRVLADVALLTPVLVCGLA